MRRPIVALPSRRGWRRRARVQWGRWQRRAAFVLGGVVVGAAAVCLALAADEAQALFSQLVARWRFAPLILTPLGLGLSVLLTRRFFQNAQGSGIPQVIAARALPTREQRAPLVSLRVALGKILLTLFGLLCGASVGREGPTVQVGASIMFAIGRLSPNRQPGLLLAGSSAGIAAAFNTPLAGIVFGIEEMSRSFETRASGLIVGGIIAAGLTSLALLGNSPYFGHFAAALHGAWGWLAVPVCGVVGGLAGGLFSRVLIAAGRAPRQRPILFAMVCGIGIALCGLASGGVTYGTGYAQTQALAFGTEAVTPTFGVFKLIATTLSAISGIPGGIFSPSLAVGAGIGANVAVLFPAVPMGAMLLLGMVSYFAGVVQAPITAFVIVSEMSDDHAMVIPLMAATLIAYAASRLVCPEGVYHALARNFLPPH